jgi:dolichol-phosphate mannosyltransferase
VTFADRLLTLLALVQTILGAGVLWRFLRTAAGQRIRVVDRAPAETGRVTVIVPVLNEIRRLGPCLDGLLDQGDEVLEILVVDGGSTDGTIDLVQSYVRRDERLRLIDASPIPVDWNGKAWGLEVGYRQADPAASWLLTIDADARPTAPLARSLLTHAWWNELAVLSVATLQRLPGTLEGLIHPSLLATLIYRYGSPGRAVRRVDEVQANGQCCLFQRRALAACGGFGVARASICEDVTIARCLVAAGYPAGLYQSENLVTVEMYESGLAALRGWARSLPMRDQYAGPAVLRGLLEVGLVQALPLPLVVLLARGRRGSLPLLVNSLLSLARLGVLLGTARVYADRPWSYWLSPLTDLPVLAEICRSLLRRRRIWPGRPVPPDPA